MSTSFDIDVGPNRFAVIVFDGNHFFDDFFTQLLLQKTNWNWICCSLIICMVWLFLMWCFLVLFGVWRPYSFWVEQVKQTSNSQSGLERHEGKVELFIESLAVIRVSYEAFEHYVKPWTRSLWFMGERLQPHCWQRSGVSFLIMPLRPVWIMVIGTI